MGPHKLTPFRFDPVLSGYMDLFYRSLGLGNGRRGSVVSLKAQSTGTCFEELALLHQIGMWETFSIMRFSCEC